jgi:hypothetical protein
MEKPRRDEPDLAAALRTARIENAERAEAIADLREIELGRLALVESALKKVVRQVPPEVDLFDLTLARGERPRVFLDMVAFIEMARDRRTYRFFQDTLHGRVLIAESPKIDAIVAACTHYVARRLVERQRALSQPIRLDVEADDAPAPHAPSEHAANPVPPVEAHSAWERQGVWHTLFDALALFLMAVGAMTVVSLLALFAALTVNHRLGEALARLRDAALSLNLPHL